MKPNWSPLGEFLWTYHQTNHSHVALPESASIASSISEVLGPAAVITKASPADPLTTCEDVSSVGPNYDTKTGKENSSESDQTTPQRAIESSEKMLSYRRGRRSVTDPLSPLQSPRLSYDKNLYIEETYMDTHHHYATLKRNATFHELFDEIPMEERLLDDFSCALSREILLQGRLYVSEHYVCFNSNLLGWVTSLVVSHDDIIGFEKKNTAGLFPNGITIETSNNKHIFASFVSRDPTFNFLETIWSKSVATSRANNESHRGVDLDLTNGPHPSDDNDTLSVQQQQELKDMILSVDSDSDSSGTVSQKSFFNLGPESHAPTSVPYNYANETELISKQLSVPPGLVFDVLFGENTQFHQYIMELGKGSQFSEYSKFLDDKREFSYTKELGYSIGPKSTKCVVTEIIEKLDFNSSCVILTKTKTPDVPSGDSFSVNTRYVMAWGPENSTQLQIGYFVEWTGRSWIKSMIEKSVLQGQKEASVLLIEKLEEKLQEITLKPIKEVEEVVEGEKELPAVPLRGPTFYDRVSKEVDYRVVAFVLIFVLQLWILVELRQIKSMVNA